MAPHPRALIVSKWKLSKRFAHASSGVTAGAELAAAERILLT